MKERRDTFVVIFGVLLFLILAAIAISTVTAKEVKNSSKEANPEEASNLCINCHEMRPEYYTWKVSSHSKFACTTCHGKDPISYTVKHDKQSFAKPIKIVEAIPDSVCQQCHSPNRLVDPPGDLIIPHDKHAAAGVACVKCHSGVVHAKIAERGLTESGELSDYKAWNDNAAQKAATKYYLQPDMWTCIECHKSLNQTRKCGACHTQIPALPSHDQPSWKAEHGKIARTNIGECTKCHVTPGTTSSITPSSGDPATDFAQAQSFCYSCHLKRPEMHETSMIRIHPDKAAERGVLNCLTCHNREQPKAEDKVTGTFCNQCHWKP